MPLRNIKGVVEYDGTDFEGFQIQSEGHRTVQGELKRVLESILNHPADIKGASRTDAGVHATGQVVSFKTSASRTLTEILDGANSRFDNDLQFVELVETSWEFHPRFDAKRKTYVYLIDRLNSVLRARYSWGITGQLDNARMLKAAELFTGEHDFRSFTTLGAHRDDITVRRIDNVSVNEIDNLIEIEITGSGFLYQMVRKMVSGLVEIGKGELENEDIEKLINEPIFDGIGSVAPAKGLILKRVYY